MKKYIIKIFHYIENLWLGNDGKPSLRAVIAIAVTIHMLINSSYAVQKWSENRSLEGITNLMLVESGFVLTLLGLSTLQNIQFRKEETKEKVATGSTADVPLKDGE